MNPEASAKVFRHQQRRFRELFWQVMKQHDIPLGNTIASPASVLSFAEDLLLCTTEDAVLVRIERGPEAARGTMIISTDAVSDIEKRGAQILIPVGPHETPFGLLAEAVCYRAQAAIDKYGDAWTR